MFYLSRSLGTDGDFWNSAGLEAFISQQRRIHAADVGGEHAYIPFLILSSSHGNANASRIECHLQFQKVLLYLTIHWDKGLESPHVAFHSRRCRCAALPQPAKLRGDSQETQSGGRDSNHRLHFIFTNRGEEKGTRQFSLLFLEGVIIT